MLLDIKTLKDENNAPVIFRRNKKFYKIKSAGGSVIYVLAEINFRALISYD